MKTATILTANDIKRLAAIHGKLGALIESVNGTAPKRSTKARAAAAANTRAAQRPRKVQSAPPPRRPLANVATSSAND